MLTRDLFAVANILVWIVQVAIRRAHSLLHILGYPWQMYQFRLQHYLASCNIKDADFQKE